MSSFQWRTVFEKLCALYSYVFAAIGLDGAGESATFRQIHRVDLWNLRTDPALSASHAFHESCLWQEHATGLAGYLGPDVVNAVMRMQLSSFFESVPQASQLPMLEVGFVQSFESLLQGLQEYRHYTVERIASGLEPLFHSQLTQIGMAVNKYLQLSSLIAGVNLAVDHRPKNTSEMLKWDQCSDPN